jgi:hypothetical protein
MSVSKIMADCYIMSHIRLNSLHWVHHHRNSSELSRTAIMSARKIVNLNYDSLLPGKESEIYAIVGLKPLISLYDAYKLIEPLVKKVIGSLGTLSESKTENIREIIRAGKENGVDEMNISLSNAAGIDIGADLSPTNIPVNCRFKVTSDNGMVINVKYK